jgi:hypothetical protein
MQALTNILLTLAILSIIIALAIIFCDYDLTENFLISNEAIADIANVYNSNNMQVTNMTATNNVQGANVTATGTASCDNALMANMKVTKGWSGYTDSNVQNAEISNDTNQFKQLMIVGNKSADSATRVVGVWDKLLVHSDLAVDNSITANKLDVPLVCVNKTTPPQQLSDTDYLDRQYVDCGSDGFLKSFHLRRDTTNTSNFVYDYTCCNFAK